MGKKKSPTVLIVGDNPDLFRIVAGNKSLLKCKQTRVKNCDKALEVASHNSTFFDFLVTDLASPKVNDDDFAEQFIKLSPMTKVMYMIL